MWVVQQYIGRLLLCFTTAQHGTQFIAYYGGNASAAFRMVGSPPVARIAV